MKSTIIPNVCLFFAVFRDRRSRRLHSNICYKSRHNYYVCFHANDFRFFILAQSSPGLKTQYLVQNTMSACRSFVNLLGCRAFLTVSNDRDSRKVYQVQIYFLRHVSARHGGNCKIDAILINFYEL